MDSVLHEEVSRQTRDGICCLARVQYLLSLEQGVSPVGDTGQVLEFLRSYDIHSAQVIGPLISYVQSFTAPLYRDDQVLVVQPCRL